jgi:enterochelin esterase-like enzyme
MSHRRIVSFAILTLLLLSACSQSVHVGQETRVAKTQSVLTQSAPAPTTEATSTAQGCSEKTGTVMRMAIDSPTLDEQLAFTIYLPPCYDAGKAGGYPVIYLLHGQNMDDKTWSALGITDAADSRIDAGAVPFIMVFPYEVHHYDNVAESKFGEAFLADLMPYIESHYAVCTEPSCRAIGGMSRGGGWAMHIALTHFNEFGAIGAHSMAYFAGDLYRVQNLLQTHTVDEFPRIYIDRGEDDYLHDTIDQYEANLTAAGVPHESHISPGSHDQDYWRSQVGNYLDWYVAGFSGQ